MDVTSQLNALHATLTMVLTRLDALEGSRATAAETTRRGRAARTQMDGGNVDRDVDRC